MSLISTENRFFGLDLGRLRRELGQAWQGLRRSPLILWMSPVVSIGLLRVDGARSLWLARETEPYMVSSATKKEGNFTAIEIPEAIFLQRSFSLPLMPDAAVEEAVVLDVRSSSPFAIDDLVWGYVAHTNPLKGMTVDVVLASSKQIAGFFLAGQEHLRLSTNNPEVWAILRERTPVVLRGFGEAQRYRAVARKRVVAGVLLVLAAVVLMAIAITPTLQLRFRAVEAVDAFTSLSQRMSPLLKQREALVQVDGQLAALQGVLADRVDPLRVMELLTRTLPDDTSVFTLQIQENKVAITGQTANAAALMQLLSEHPLLRDVRAPSAAMRPPGASKDTFGIELTMDAKALTSTDSLSSSALPVGLSAPGVSVANGPVPAASAPAEPASSRKAASGAKP